MDDDIQKDASAFRNSYNNSEPEEVFVDERSVERHLDRTFDRYENQRLAAEKVSRDEAAYRSKRPNDPQIISRVSGLQFEAELQGKTISPLEALNQAIGEKSASESRAASQRALDATAEDVLTADEYALKMNLVEKKVSNDPDAELTSDQIKAKYGL